MTNASTSPLPGHWWVVIPVKAPDRGKSRIAVAPAARAEIAAALAFDTVAGVAAAQQVRAVVVVTDGATQLGWTADLPVGGHKVLVVASAADTLNEAIRDGIAACPSGPVAVLPGDLPGVSGAGLDAVLCALDAPLSVLPDSDGVGTTLLAARSGALLDPHYGLGSFRQHLAAGAVPIDLPAAHWLRRDVDTVQEFPLIIDGAPSSRTAQVIARMRRGHGVHTSDAAGTRC